MKTKGYTQFYLILLLLLFCFSSCVQLWCLHRFLEWSGCCCGGTESSQNGGEEHLFPVSSVVSCRDTTYPHPRTKSCDLLSQLSTSIPIDNSGSVYILYIYFLVMKLEYFPYLAVCILTQYTTINRIHTQTLLSNQPTWVNYSNSLDPTILDVSQLFMFLFYFHFI